MARTYWKPRQTLSGCLRRTPDEFEQHGDDLYSVNDNTCPYGLFLTASGSRSIKMFFLFSVEMTNPLQLMTHLLSLIKEVLSLIFRDSLTTVYWKVTETELICYSSRAIITLITLSSVVSELILLSWFKHCKLRECLIMPRVSLYF